MRGLTSVAAVAVSGDGTIYASEMFAGCAPKATNCTPGQVTVIPRHGARYSIKAPYTGGVAVRGGCLYASVLSVAPGGGAVWRIN
ncbi:MAG: hypothetical protein ABJC62_11570 [Frankiaceae bacterium]